MKWAGVQYATGLVPSGPLTAQVSPCPSDQYRAQTPLFPSGGGGGVAGDTNLETSTAVLKATWPGYWQGSTEGKRARPRAGEGDEGPACHPGQSDTGCLVTMGDGPQAPAWTPTQLTPGVGLGALS